MLQSTDHPLVPPARRERRRRAIAIVSAAVCLVWADGLLAQVTPTASDIVANVGAAARAARIALVRPLLEAGRTQEARASLVPLLAEAEANGDHTAASIIEASLGRASGLDGDFAAADRYFDAARTRATTRNLPRAMAWVHTLAGNHAYGLGNREGAFAEWEAAYSLSDRGNDPALRLTLAVYLGAAGAPRAEERLGWALSTARELNNAGVEGRALLALSEMAYLRGQWRQALALATEAMPLLEAHGSPIERARAWLNLGRLRRSHGDQVAAGAAYQRAESLLGTVDRGLGLSIAWSILASGYLNLDDGRRAEAAARMAVKVAEASTSPTDRWSSTYVLAAVLLANNVPAEAVKAIETAGTPSPRLAVGLGAYRARALSALGRHADAVAVAQVTAALDEPDAAWAPHHRTLLAEVFHRAGQPADAITMARQAMAFMQGARANAASSDESRSGFDHEFAFVARNLVRVLLDAGDPEAALEAAEAARAQNFTELLARRDTAVDSTPRGTVGVVDMIEAARRMRSVIVAYWTDVAGVAIWVVTDAGFKGVVRVPIGDARLQALVARTLSDREPLAGSGGTSAFRELHDLLVAPVRSLVGAAGLGRLAIVSHGPLQRLSFAALQDSRGRHLVESTAVHYLPSIAAAASLHRDDAPPAAAVSALPALVVASPVVSAARRRSEGLTPLPGARAEARRVGRWLQPNITLAGSDATEGRARLAAAGSRVLHFATHAVASDDDPMASYLALTAEGDDDGRLSASEIYSWTIEAELVVLSACKSVGGRRTGEGVSGLARAFFAAGASSVVASLTDLPDAVGADVFDRFYASWRRSGDTADALRRAQLALLTQLREGRLAVTTAAGPVQLPAHPSVWAGLITVGAPSSVARRGGDQRGSTAAGLRQR